MPKRIPGDRAPKSLLGKLLLLLRTPRRGRGFWFGLAIDLLWPMVMSATKPIWRGGENIPKTGPVLLAANHISFADPITLTAFTLAGGRVPRYLARANLWQTPVLRWVMKGGKHIPVTRGTAIAAGAYQAGLDSLVDGNCLVLFPEGTYTRDPEGWPMRGKTGIARLALITGTPVVPIGHWGTQELLPPGGKPRLRPRKTVHIHAGPPVDLSDLQSTEPTREQLFAATERIMAAITASVSEIRGIAKEQAPKVQDEPAA